MDKEQVKETVKQIIDQREEIIKAFIAKYECGPEEIMQIMQKTEDGGVKFCVRKKTEDEESLGTVMGYIDKAVKDCDAAMLRANLRHDRVRAAMMKLRGDCFREVLGQLKARTKETSEPAGDAGQEEEAISGNA